MLLSLNPGICREEKKNVHFFKLQCPVESKSTITGDTNLVPGQKNRNSGV